ncbi:MAG: prepilin-type N-terminal cleavage/methylation domain-containing protein [Candidatus Kryptoniota bacterium]
MKRIRLLLSKDHGFSMVELMVVLVIIGILVLLALPRLEPVVTKAKTTEAKLMLKQLYTLEKSYKFENDHYSTSLDEIGFEQEKLVTDGGRARYKIEIVSADEKSFVAQATAVVDFNNNGKFNVWTVDETGDIKEKVSAN